MHDVWLTVWSNALDCHSSPFTPPLPTRAVVYHADRHISRLGQLAISGSLEEFVTPRTAYYRDWERRNSRDGAMAVTDLDPFM